jgi:hypothetical protein
MASELHGVHRETLGADWRILGGDDLTVVGGFVCGGRDYLDGLEKAPMVEPVDPLDHGELDVIDRAPGPRRPMTSVLNSPITGSASALSKLSPTEPTEGSRPASASTMSAKVLTMRPPRGSPSGFDDFVAPSRTSAVRRRDAAVAPHRSTEPTGDALPTSSAASARSRPSCVHGVEPGFDDRVLPDLGGVAEELGDEELRSLQALVAREGVDGCNYERCGLRD